MSESNADWQAQPPEWLAAMNREGNCFDLSAVVPMDEASLLASACQATGLSDFGDDSWREPFRILIRALEEEAQLTLMGRLMARHDLHCWLRTRLEVTELFKRHPEIADERIEAPMVIVGLPRSGTSILFELLSQDTAVGVPLMWEALRPCPPPQRDSYAHDERIVWADALFTQWSRVVPAFAAMHEMRGDIPAECGLIMAPSFISDHVASLHQTPSYSAWYAQADMAPAYAFHKKVLQVLQWKNPRQRWLLKAPEHQVHLAHLLATYPDARIVQTHRDPIKCMASSASLMGALYAMRSDQPFNVALFENFILGEATAARLEKVIDQRHSGVVPAANITDSRYQDLMEDPIACIEGIYRHFQLSLTDATRTRMLDYLARKPKGKFGAHRYQVAQSKAKERALFQRYQTTYDVPDEV